MPCVATRVRAIALCSLALVFGCGEDTTAPSAADPAALASAAVQTLAFRQISAGDLHTCGVTTDDRAYCWGANSDFGFDVDGGGAAGRRYHRQLPAEAHRGRRWAAVPRSERRDQP
jgi:alpha-tubulin suppressor-like RCC1 family protein